MGAKRGSESVKMSGKHKVELARAIDDHDLPRFRKCFEVGDLESNAYGGSLLHYAAEFGCLEIVQFLVESGADINRRGGTYDAPAVTYAAGEGNFDIVRYLIESGSVLDTSHALRNPLLNAAEEGHYEIVKYLLSARINPDATYRIPSGSLINAMTNATRGKNEKVIELLKAHGCHDPVEGVDIPIWEPKEFRNKQVPVVESGRAVIDYMEQRFGPVDKDGMQEVIPVMEGLSVTINVIRPNEIHPYLVLFTNGMSDRPMKVPTGSEQWQFAELVMHLPPDWIHPQDANSDPRWMWPIKWLRLMAYYPYSNDTWLGLPAAIVSSAEPPEPLGPGTEQSCLLMIPDFANLDLPLQRADGTQVHFYTLVPLYTNERDFELEHGMKAFFKRFSERKVQMTVELDRPSFAS